MTYVAIPGGWRYGLPQKDLLYQNPYSINNTSLVIDATGEQVAFIGPYINPSHESRDISTVRVLMGALTSAGGSKIRVSLQAVDAANGPVFRPDGTPLGKADVLLSALTASAVNTFTLDANVTLTHGQMIAVVFEFDPGGRLGADIIRVAGLSTSANALSGIATYTGGAWASINLIPNVAFGDTGGGIGTLTFGALFSNRNGTTFNSGDATADEIGNRIVLPFKAKAIGMWAQVGSPGGNFDLVVRDSGGAEIAAVTQDGNQLVQSSNWTVIERFFSAEVEVASAAGAVVHATLRPAASNISILWTDVPANADLALVPGGINVYQSRWKDNAAVDTTTTRFNHVGLILSAIDDGAGGGGGLLTHAGMSGGMNS